MGIFLPKVSRYQPIVRHDSVFQTQRTYTRSSEPPTAIKIDMNDPDYPAHVWLMIFYGLLDSMWQTTAYWLMGAMSNDPAKLAVFAGFCKFSLRSHVIARVLILTTFYFLRQMLPVFWVRYRLAPRRSAKTVSIVLFQKDTAIDLFL
jgi:hypothetical protein